MATTLGLFAKTDLNSMCTQFQQNKKFKNYLEFDYDLSAGFGKYMNKTMLHEAGYDSYLTGVAFGSLVKHLEAQNLLEYQRTHSTTTTTNPTFLSSRTDGAVSVCVPNVATLAEIAQKSINLGCAAEFSNFI